MRLRVVGAAMMRGRRVFVAQRDRGSEAGKWEFPGGKLEPGESPAQALARELAEELGVQVEVGAFVASSLLLDTQRQPPRELQLDLYLVELPAGEPCLSEHRAAGWFALDELQGLDWAKADIPLVSALQAYCERWLDSAATAPRGK